MSLVNQGTRIGILLTVVSYGLGVTSGAGIMSGDRWGRLLALVLTVVVVLLVGAMLALGRTNSPGS